jgi:hypothetical protein
MIFKTVKRPIEVYHDSQSDQLDGRSSDLKVIGLIGRGPNVRLIWTTIVA